MSIERNSLDNVIKSNDLVVIFGIFVRTIAKHMSLVYFLHDLVKSLRMAGSVALTILCNFLFFEISYVFQMSLFFTSIALNPSYVLSV